MQAIASPAADLRHAALALLRAALSQRPSAGIFLLYSPGADDPLGLRDPAPLADADRAAGQAPPAKPHTRTVARIPWGRMPAAYQSRIIELDCRKVAAYLLESHPGLDDPLLEESFTLAGSYLNGQSADGIRRTSRPPSGRLAGQHRHGRRHRAPPCRRRHAAAGSRRSRLRHRLARPSRAGRHVGAFECRSAHAAAGPRYDLDRHRRAGAARSVVGLVRRHGGRTRSRKRSSRPGCATNPPCWHCWRSGAAIAQSRASPCRHMHRKPSTATWPRHGGRAWMAKTCKPMRSGLRLRPGFELEPAVRQALAQAAQNPDTLAQLLPAALAGPLLERYAIDPPATACDGDLPR